jgi:metal-responsive CopG/Arc/MetJ family transcriptional regulator
MKYPRRMRPMSLKLSQDLEELLDRLAEERGMTRSDVVREALRAFAAEERPSVTSAAGDLVGTLRGARDLSTAARHMEGFGE